MRFVGTSAQKALDSIRVVFVICVGSYKPHEHSHLPSSAVRFLMKRFLEEHRQAKLDKQ